MGTLKLQALKKNNEDIVVHELTPQEINYLKLLSLTLQYHTYAQKIMSGYLYYVSTNRLGYANGVDLMFEIDLEKDNLLTIKLMPPQVEATL